MTGQTEHCIRLTATAVKLLQWCFSEEDALEEERDLSTNQKTTYRLFMEDSGVNEIDDGGFGYEPNLKVREETKAIFLRPQKQ